MPESSPALVHHLELAGCKCLVCIFSLEQPWLATSRPLLLGVLHASHALLSHGLEPAIRPAHTGGQPGYRTTFIEDVSTPAHCVAAPKACLVWSGLPDRTTRSGQASILDMSLKMHTTNAGYPARSTRSRMLPGLTRCKGTPAHPTGQAAASLLLNRDAQNVLLCQKRPSKRGPRPMAKTRPYSHVLKRRIKTSSKLSICSTQQFCLVRLSRFVPSPLLARSKEVQGVDQERQWRSKRETSLRLTSAFASFDEPAHCQRVIRIGNTVHLPLVKACNQHLGSLTRSPIAGLHHRRRFRARIRRRLEGFQI